MNFRVLRFASAGRTLGLIFCVLLAVLLWQVDHPLYVIIAALPDGIHRPMPFEDLTAILRAGMCWRHGVNVYAPSSCLAGGVYNYSPFLLRAAYLPVRARDFLPLDSAPRADSSWHRRSFRQFCPRTGAVLQPP